MTSRDTRGLHSDLGAQTGGSRWIWNLRIAAGALWYIGLLVLGSCAGAPSSAAVDGEVATEEEPRGSIRAARRGEPGRSREAADTGDPFSALRGGPSETASRDAGPEAGERAARTAETARPASPEGDVARRAGEGQPIASRQPASGSGTSEPRSPGGPSPAKRRRVVRDYVERLSGDVAEAEAAYRELLKAPRGLIPDLIREVENPRRTRVRKLDVIALHDRIVRVDDKSGRMYYFVKGMGRFQFDDVATGPVRGQPRATRVRFRNFDEGFPVGVVIRAALLNRIRSGRYPPSDDVDLVRWWMAYYERASLQ